MRGSVSLDIILKNTSNMLRVIILAILWSKVTCHVVVSDGTLYEVNLYWPDKYTVKVTRMSLSADLTENIEAWVNSTSSRVDHNGGTAKTITHIFEDISENVKYEIHPMINEMICEKIKMGYLVELEKVLPDIESHNYTNIGAEIIVDIDCEKFQYVEDNGEEKTRSVYTIWAQFVDLNSNDSFWNPVRYEFLKYSSRYGSEIKHEVWYFSEFHTTFDNDVFNENKFDCDTYMKYTMENEVVTKELMFIDTVNHKHVDYIFNSFKNKFGCNYTNAAEHALRQSIFEDNMRLISNINHKNLTYKLAVNQFADRTPEEMRTKHTGLWKSPVGKNRNNRFLYTTEMLDIVDSNLPEEYDARLHGLVGPVKDQGECGSCWTYSTTAAVEGALAKANKDKLLSLSNQALIDCAWEFAAGCNGGSNTAAYEWIIRHGLPTEEEYGPYKNTDGYCHINNMTKLYNIQNYAYVKPFNILAAKKALVSYGPLSVNVEVTDKFKFYSRGVYYEEGCGHSILNHAVTLVGYGLENGEIFWLLKNSWGTGWGNAGFMQINTKDNNCGVTTNPTYVIV